jgi:hypothetical protein
MVDPFLWTDFVIYIELALKLPPTQMGWMMHWYSVQPCYECQVTLAHANPNN